MRTKEYARLHRSLRSIASAALLLALAFPALAEEPSLPANLTARDKAVLSGYALYREKALAAALPHADSPKDAAEITKLTSAPAQPISARGLEGDWRCRSLQADSFGVFIYPFFKCRIAVDAAGRLMFQKTSGSQRSSGELLQHSDDRLLFVGAATVNDDPVKNYGESEEANVVGFLFKLGPRRLRLELKNKGFEILELVK